MKRKYHHRFRIQAKRRYLAFHHMLIKNSFIRNLWADIKQTIKETK